VNKGFESTLIRKKMQILSTPYTVIDWDDVSITKHFGETGFTWCRTYETGNIRIRLVEYSPGFRSDHWCCRGHIIHLLDGEIKFELKDGSLLRLIKGMSCCFGESKAIAHKPLTETGAFLLIID
jgi:uncharacterized cupin superfamily protein